MSFLAGTFLAGFGLIGLPVLIHLFSRKRRREVAWGAMQFLMHNKPRFRRRSIQLNELLLLLFRVLAIAALVLAFAQPTIWSGLIGRSASEVVLIIDGSLSTARKTGEGQSAFTQEIAAASKVLSGLGENDTVRVLLATDASRWLTPAPLYATEANREALRAMLNALQPTVSGSDMASAISEALQVHAPADRGSRRVLVLSDSTERPWKGRDTQRWSAIEKAIRNASIPTTIEILRVSPAPEPSGLTNLSVDRVNADHDVVVTGESISLTAEIRNRSGKTSEPIDLLWLVDEREVGRTPLPALDAATSTTVEFSIPCDTPGDHLVRCRVTAADDLALDDEATIAIRTLNEIPLLVVDGGRQPKSELVPECGFFLAALGHTPGSKEFTKGRSVFQPTVISPDELASVHFSRFLCVVLANVAKLDQQQVKRLVTHVATGGGLWLALGDHTDLQAFNESFSPRGVGLSPVSIGAATGELSDNTPGWSVSPPSQNHPATKLLGDTSQLDLDKMRVQRHHTVLAPIPADLRSLFRLETQAPLVIEHSFGKGRVLVQMVPLNRTWNNLPILQSYVPVVREFLWRVSEGKLIRKNLAPGEMFHLHVTEEKDVPFVVSLPDGRKFSGASQRGEVRFSDTFMPGVYRLDGASSVPELFNVQRSPDESDLAPLSETTLRMLRKLGVLIGKEADAVDGIGISVRERRLLTPHLLWALLGLLILEVLLSGYLSGRRNVRPRPIVLDLVTTR